MLPTKKYHCLRFDSVRVNDAYLMFFLLREKNCIVEEKISEDMTV